MTAPKGLFAEYINDEDPKETILSQVVCIALTDQGDIWLMDIDSEGWIERADTTGNFKGIVWGNHEDVKQDE